MKTVLIVFEEPTAPADVVNITRAINLAGFSVKLDLPDIEPPTPTPELPAEPEEKKPAIKKGKKKLKDLSIEEKRARWREYANKKRKNKKAPCPAS